MSSATVPVTHQSPMPASATIFLVRHGEKPDSGTGLSPAGQARADAYVKYFQNLQDPQGKIIHWDQLCLHARIRTIVIVPHLLSHPLQRQLL
jgi:hypothetical protein